jgi:nucleoid DNA-binding protein
MDLKKLIQPKEKSSMQKTQFVRLVSNETRLPQRVVSDVLNTSHRLIEDTLRKKRSVVFPGFGKFYTSERKGGKAKNIRTGEPVSYKARTVALFRPGDILRRAVRGERRR